MPADVQVRMEPIYREECLALLATQEVGRLAVVEGGSPLILPITYVMDGDAIVFRTDPGTKLSGATRAPVAFEVDSVDPVTRTGWSVVARGLAQEITSADREDVQARVAALPLHPWAPGPKSHLIRITCTTLMGRRLCMR